MDRKKLKICHVITRMIIGGAQENTLLSAIGQAEKGHDVVLLTGLTTGPEGRLLEGKNTGKVNVVENPNLVRELCPLSDIKAYYELKKYFAAEKFDVVHTHSSKAGIVGRYAAWNAKIPLVVHTIHGQAFHRYEKPWKNKLYIFLEKLAEKKCHRIFAVAQAMINQCLENGIGYPEKYRVVYSGMEIEPFLNSRCDYELKKKLGIPDNSLVVGTLARLFHLKGYDHILQIAKKIIGVVPNAYFLLIGDGILKEKIKGDARKAGLEKYFVFAGLLRPELIPSYLSIVDVLLHLSLREGLPRSVVQSLASGKPAVAFNLDGTPEVLINGKTGFITGPDEIDKVINYTIELLKDQNKREEMGKNGRALVAKNFNWRFMVDELESEYYRQMEINSKN